MARKPNYDFEKRRKELNRKAKKDAKREDKLRRKRADTTEEQPTSAGQGEGAAPPVE